MSLEVILKGERVDLSTVVYTVFLSSFILLAGLYIHYRIDKKPNYNILNKVLASENYSYLFSLPKQSSREDDVYKKVLVGQLEEYIVNLKKYEDEYKLKSEFNDLWVHQMKTPVSVMKLILEKDLEDVDKMSLLEELEKVSNSLDIGLYTHRHNDFTGDLKGESINLKGLLGEILKENKNSFIYNSIYPKLDVDENIYISTDYKWMKFVITQIIQNSIKYTKVKKEASSIDIKTVERDRQLILELKDYGVGIPQKDLKRLRDPFFTGENGRRYSESTGMGLYITYDVLEKLGHGIEIESLQDEYTTVRLIFDTDVNIYSV